MLGISIESHYVLDDITGNLVLADFNVEIFGRIEEIYATLQVISTVLLWLLQHKVILSRLIHNICQN